MREPARGYSWPPFEPGNFVAEHHGARSNRRVQPIAERLAGGLAVIAPWTASPSFAGAVASWAWAEAQVLLLRRHIDEVGLIDGDGPPPALASLDKVESRLLKLRDSLGLTPLSLGRLLSSAASVASATHDGASLDALKNEGKRILAARTEPDVNDG